MNVVKKFVSKRRAALTPAQVAELAKRKVARQKKLAQLRLSNVPKTS